MLGVVLLLIAAGVVVLLAVVLATAVGARLRERQASAPSAGEAAALPDGAAKPRKPTLVPWLVASGAMAFVALVISLGLLKGCQAMGDIGRESQKQARCQNATAAMAQQFANYWDANKALPPDGSGILASADCPLGHHFIYFGQRKALLGTLRVVAAEDEPHGDSGHHAVVVEQSFLDAGKTTAEADQAAGNVQPYYGWDPRYFRVQQITAGQFEQIREAPVEISK